MALNYGILSLKPNITKEIDGIQETYKDLLPSTINHNITLDTTNCVHIIVNKYYVARPDLISLAFYGDDSFADVLCKINGISNPFELQENTVMLIPRIDVMANLVKNASASVVTTNSAASIGQDTKMSYKKKTTDKRSPNEQTVNDKNYVVDYKNNMIYY